MWILSFWSIIILCGSCFLLSLLNNFLVFDRLVILMIEFRKKKLIWIKGSLVDKYWSYIVVMFICDMLFVIVFWFVYLSFIWMMDEICIFYWLFYFFDVFCLCNVLRRGYCDFEGWIFFCILCVYLDVGLMRLFLILVYYKIYNNLMGW